MAARLAAPGLAAVALCSSLAGAGGFATFVLLAAIVAGAAWLLATVGAAAEGRSGRLPVVLAAAGLIWLVAAGAARVPLLALGLLVCAALELLAGVDGGAEVVAEPVELADTPVSRAA